jgi:hypothetical protein
MLAPCFRAVETTDLRVAKISAPSILGVEMLIAKPRVAASMNWHGPPGWIFRNGPVVKSPECPRQGNRVKKDVTNG